MKKTKTRLIEKLNLEKETDEIAQKAVGESYIGDCTLKELKNILPQNMKTNHFPKEKRYYHNKKKIIIFWFKDNRNILLLDLSDYPKEYKRAIGK